MLERVPESHGARQAAVAAFAVTCTALLLLYRYQPAGLLYPSCWVHALTGLYCPGCGGTRALHALLHGELRQAVDFNAMIVLLAPAVLGWCFLLLYRALRYNRIRLPAIPGRVLAGAVLTAVAFAVLRNLPLGPFSVLAP